MTGINKQSDGISLLYSSSDTQAKMHRTFFTDTSRKIQILPLKGEVITDLSTPSPIANTCPDFQSLPLVTTTFPNF